MRCAWTLKEPQISLCVKFDSTALDMPTIFFRLSVHMENLSSRFYAWWFPLLPFFLFCWLCAYFAHTVAHVCHPRCTLEHVRKSSQVVKRPASHHASYVFFSSTGHNSGTHDFGRSFDSTQWPLKIVEKEPAQSEISDILHPLRDITHCHHFIPLVMC